jgi:hypothetical protein
MNEFFTNYDAAKEVNVHSPKNAVIFMIFALAQGFKGIGNDSGNGDSECRYECVINCFVNANVVKFPVFPGCREPAEG